MSDAQERAAEVIRRAAEISAVTEDLDNPRGIAAALAGAHLLVDDDTARLVALGEAVEGWRAQFPTGCAANASHVTFGYVACLDAIYRAAGVTPEDGR